MRNRIKRWRGILTLPLLAMFLMTSCNDNSMNDYVLTVQSGIKKLPWPIQMEKLFGDGDHFITEYGFSSGPRVWHSEVFFGSRYTLAVEVKVDINYNNHTVVGIVSEPTFYLHEVESVTVSGNRVRATFAHQWVLDKAQWEKLVKAKGDWSILGIPIKTNAAVPGFDEYIKSLRGPRVKIPH